MGGVVGSMGGVVHVPKRPFVGGNWAYYPCCGAVSTVPSRRRLAGGCILIVDDAGWRGWVVYSSKTIAERGHGCGEWLPKNHKKSAPPSAHKPTAISIGPRRSNAHGSQDLCIGPGEGPRAAACGEWAHAMGCCHGMVHLQLEPAHFLFSLQTMLTLNG